MIARRTLLITAAAGALAACEIGTTEPETTQLPRSVDGTRNFGPILGDDFITQFAFTPDGVLWVATLQGRVIREFEGVATVYDLAAESGDETVTDLFVDPGGRVWVTTPSTYWRWDERWVQRPGAGTVSFDFPLVEIAVDAAGDVLVASGNASGGGLWLRSGDQWRSFTPQTSDLPSSITHDIAVGEDGAFWIASSAIDGRGGVSRLAGGVLDPVFDQPSSGLLYAGVDHVAVAGERIFLGFEARFFDEVGFPDGGIQVLSPDDGSTEAFFPSETGVASNRITAMTGTDAGELWFTTGLDHDLSGCETCVSGVGRLDASGTFRMLERAKYGLEPNAFLPWIAEDPAGDVHFATESLVVPVR